MHVCPPVASSSTQGGKEMNPFWNELKNCEAEFEQIQGVGDRLLKGANATVVVLLNKNGQPIAVSGALGELNALSMNELSIDERDEAHILRVGGRVALVTIYPRETSRLALVLQGVRAASDELYHILATLSEKLQKEGFDQFFPEITDEEMNELLKD
jgi:hypothetical protein